MSIQKIFITISRIILVVLQLSSCPIFTLSKVIAADSSANDGGITVRFSDNRKAGGKQIECKRNDGKGDESDIQRIQAHVEKELKRLIADNPFTSGVKITVPPEMQGSLKGGAHIIFPFSESKEAPRIPIPVSGRSESIERVNAARKDVRRKMYEYDKKRKNKYASRFVGNPNDKEVKQSKREDEKNTNRKPGGLEIKNDISDAESSSVIDHEKILKTLKWKSYSEATSCTSNEEITLISMIQSIIPISFRRYDCPRLVQELDHHQASAMWSERAVLEELFFSLIGFSVEEILNEEEWEDHPLVQHDDWLSEEHYCDWGGVTCGITTIGVGDGNLENTFDTAESNFIDECKKDRLRARHRNRCDGKRYLDGWRCEPCPPNHNVTKLDLTILAFTGVLPDNLYMLTYLHRLNVMGSLIKGGIPSTFKKFKYLEFIDVSKNSMYGPLSLDHLPVSLNELWLEENRFTGTLADSICNLTSLSHLDISNNNIEGSIPRVIGNMTWLNSLWLSENQLTGKIPDFLPTIYLRILDLSHNDLEGTIPPSISQSLYALEQLDLSSNHLTGAVPDFPHNIQHLLLNLTANEFTGKIPSSFCKGPYTTMFGCDAIMCKAGQFSPTGAASHFGPCMDCPDDEPFLGQTTCSGGANYLIGDMNLDGSLSEREVLHLLYTFTDGFKWEPRYESWADIKIPSCELYGITCEDNKVTHINLTDANLCSGDTKYNKGCSGLPSEIGLLTGLKSLEIRGGAEKLRGTLPYEMGSLKFLEHINLEGSALTGSVSHLARLESLRYLNLQNCELAGDLPLFGSSNTKLEIIDLGLNEFEGTIPSSYGHIKNLEELILSRNKLSGTIIDFSRLQKLDNLELYGNVLRGTIPKNLGSCSELKRIDLFSNMLTGTIPSELGNIPALQILSLKANNLSGSLPPTLLDNLPNFMWLDASGNHLTGTIPSSYGFSNSLKDLRLGGNELYGPISDSLCMRKDINDPNGDRGCDHILCSLGTISEAGYATKSSPCVPCPVGQSTLYLGSDNCREFTEKDILKMMYEYLSDDNWSDEYKQDWTSDKDLCDWHGVTCDDEEEIIRLTFPNSGLDL